ncbi:MAG: hypothetical protein GF416_04570 [Candidatus Altiarchaeales archaeon]|nr:hypothetical protein [Candidatus Altiarchaeales archaeon]MBD3416394.1 hypothetical protein [Candidatus Altiarchaeales archaeon]
MAVAEIAYAEFAGVALIVWSGISSLALVVLTALTGRNLLPVKYHRKLAFAAIFFAFGHGILAAAANLGL